MFNALFAACKHITHFRSVINVLEQFVTLTGEDYIKDSNAADAMIDAAIQILQAHKSGGQNGQSK